MMHDELTPGEQPPPNAAICPTCMQMRVAATDITFEMRRRLGVNARTAAIINRAHSMGAAVIAACSSWDAADLRPTPVERLRLYAHGCHRGDEHGRAAGPHIMGRSDAF